MLFDTNSLRARDSTFCTNQIETHWKNEPSDIANMILGILFFENGYSIVCKKFKKTNCLHIKLFNSHYVYLYCRTTR